MNLEKVNTVNDLINQNKEQTPFDAAIDALTKCDAKQSKLIAMMLINNLSEWHHSVAEGDDVDKNTACSWVYDEAKLNTALNILSTVKMPGEEENAAE